MSTRPRTPAPGTPAPGKLAITECQLGCVDGACRPLPPDCKVEDMACDGALLTGCGPPIDCVALRWPT